MIDTIKKMLYNGSKINSHMLHIQMKKSLKNIFLIKKIFVIVINRRCHPDDVMLHDLDLKVIGQDH